MIGIFTMQATLRLAASAPPHPLAPQLQSRISASLTDVTRGGAVNSATFEQLSARPVVKRGVERRQLVDRIRQHRWCPAPRRRVRGWRRMCGLGCCRILSDRGGMNRGTAFLLEIRADEGDPAHRDLTRLYAIRAASSVLRPSVNSPIDVLSAPDGADLELWNGLKAWDVSDRIGFMRVGRRD